MRLMITTTFTIFLITSGTSQSISSKVKKQIEKQIANLRTAHLESNADLADKIYDNQLILTSQSGKKYAKKKP